MGTKKIAVIVGSLRKGSFSRKLAEVLIAAAPGTLEMKIVEIAGLPLYNQDSDDAPPEVYTRFREALIGFDGFLFVTPEHNRSVPAALKNALDVGSRPYGRNAWSGKPGAVISVSIGAIGGFGANHHLRQTLAFLNIPVMPQPEAYIGNAGDLFGSYGELVNNSTLEFIAKFIQSFAAWVARNS